MKIVTKLQIFFRQVYWNQENPFNWKPWSQTIMLDCPFKTLFMAIYSTAKYDLKAPVQILNNI